MRGVDPLDLLASLPPGRAVLVRDVAGARRREWEAAARACGWAWCEADADRPLSRSVVMAPMADPVLLARRVAGCSLRGAHAIVALGGGAVPRRCDGPARWMAREARAVYGDDGRGAIDTCLARWRSGDAEGGRRALDSVASPGDPQSHMAVDALVLASLVAGECRDGVAAEAHARAGQLVARLGNDARGRACADLALARVWLRRGQPGRALGLVRRAGAEDAAVGVIRAAIGVRCGMEAGLIGAAARFAAVLDRLATDDWATCHRHAARAFLAAGTGASGEAARHVAKASSIALRQGWTRRLTRLRDLSDRLRASGGESDSGEGERRWDVVDDLLAIFQVCQEHGNPSAAADEVAVRLRGRLGARHVGILGRSVGGLWPVGAAGTTMAVPAWLPDVAASGATRPPSAADGPPAAAAPIKTEGEVVGVVVCVWWPGDEPVEDEAVPLMEASATALGPLVRTLAGERRAAEAGAALLGDLVGMSRAMQGVRDAVMRAAAAPFPVLIEGESGSGKELVARAIHRVSPRRGGPFVALNCAAMSDELVEAELFGHARGAFTGAVSERTGLFEEAGDGTLFLDEVAELSARAQAKLLRVLQDGEVRRVGENRARTVDVRMVAATNRPLAQEVRGGRFRADLTYRLDVLRIVVPPLRARLEDLPELAAHLWRDLTARTGCRAVPGADLLAALARYDWPGNVRELQNVLATTMVAAPRRGVVPVAALPPHVRASTRLDAPLPHLEVARREFEARYVAAALARAGGRAAVAARELGVTRQGLAKLMTRLGVAPPGLDAGAR